MSLHLVAQGIASAFLASDWTPSDMVAKGAVALGGAARWLSGLAHRARDTFPDPPRHDPEALAAFLAQDARFMRAWSRSRGRTGSPVAIHEHFVTVPTMRPD